MINKKKNKSSPGSDEIDIFYERLSCCNTKPAILSLVPKYLAGYIPKTLLPTFPKPLPQLYQPEYMDLDYHELLKACESQKVDITEELALNVEKETMLQYNSKLWFQYRAGRVTASRMKAVCCTDPSNPSQSLVKAICYHESFCFTSKRTS